MRTLALRVTLLASLAGCTTPLSTEESAIIGGTRSTGASATMMLVGYPPDRSVIHTCTAVLVAPGVLLTAAHCIDAPTHPNYSYGVFTGDDASPYPLLVDLEPHLEGVAQVYPHPSYSSMLPFYADIGVVVLDAALTVAPMPMPSALLDATIIGKPATIIGYGQTTYQEFNSARYEATTTVTAIENDTFVVGDAQTRSCLGDSGGPVIVDGMVVGIDSYGPTGCGGPAHYRRVDTFLPFITPFLPPAPGGADAGPDAGPGTTEPTDDGGCRTGGGGSLGLALGVLALAPRRRRRA